MARMRAAGVGGALLIFALALAPAASGVTLHDQMNAANAMATLSDDYVPAEDFFDIQLADDFTIPAGESWRITRVETSGKDDGALSRQVHVVIYQDAGGLPGADVHATLFAQGFGYPHYEVPLANPPALPPGTYWLSVIQAGATTTTEWAWRNRFGQTGRPAMLRSPAGGSSGCRVWAPSLSCGGGGPDAMFRLIGSTRLPTKPSNRFALGKPIARPDGSAVIPARFDSPGVAVVSTPRRANSRGAIAPRRLIRRRVRRVPGGPRVRLRVKPNRAALARMRSGETLRVRVRVDFRPDGGDRNRKTKRVRLDHGPRR